MDPEAVLLWRYEMSWIISFLIAIGVLLGLVGLFLLLNSKSRLKDAATVIICVIGSVGILLLYTLTIHMMIWG